ncbi:expressed protein, partial [Phakopsora pachyrhizi]
MNYHHQDPWNLAPVEDLSFFSHNNQEETRTHVGSSQNHGSSSNIFQPLYNGDLFGGNIVNLVPNCDAFRQPDSSFLPQQHQTFGISSDEQMSQYSDFHIIQNDFSNSPHHFEIRDRVCQNQDLEVSDFNPESSSQYTGSIKNDELFDHRSNSIGDEHLNLLTSMSLAEADESLREWSELITILNKDFSRCTKESLLVRILRKASKIEVNHLEIIHEETLDYINRKNFEKDSLARLTSKQRIV